MTTFWEFFWLVIEIFVFVAYVMVLFHVLADIFRDRDMSGAVKALWIVGLVFIPVIVAFIYLLVRGNGMAAREQARAAALKSQTDQYVREVAGHSPSSEIANAKALLDSGVITPDEFDQLKRQALAGA